jgi:GlpG protein
MRLIAKFENKEQARRFLGYLIQENCPGLLENDGQEHAVWVYDEDQYEKATTLLEKFSNPEFKETIREEAILQEKETGPIPLSEDPIFLAQVQDLKKKMLSKALYQRFNARITRLIILFCSFLLVLNVFYHVRNAQAPDGSNLYSPLDRLLCYDVPLSPNDPSYARSWQGIYPILEGAPESKGTLFAPKFQEILKGQIWRLITPIFLHAGLIHLLFNMLWLWLLGKQIEERILASRYLVLTVLLAALTNTVQYLLSGPNFIGYSGVVCGLAGFIWAKQKISPWEGYPIPKSTLNFLFIFVFGIGLVQVVAFLLSYMQIATLPINIANGAHISGVFFGALLARLHYFDRQKK